MRSQGAKAFSILPIAFSINLLFLIIITIAMTIFHLSIRSMGRGTLFFLYFCCLVCMRAKSLQLNPTLCDPMDCSLPGSSVHGDSPGKNTGIGCHVLLQGIFLTQILNLLLFCLLHWQVGALPLAPPGEPRV